MHYIASQHSRPSVHVEELYPMRGDPVAQNTTDLNEKSLKKIPNPTL